MNLQAESFAQIKPPHIRVFNQFRRRAAAQNFPFRHNISAVGDAESFADIVVGNQNSDALIFQIKNNFPNIVNRNRVNSGKRFVQQNILRLGRQTTAISTRRRSPPESASPRVRERASTPNSSSNSSSRANLSARESFIVSKMARIFCSADIF
jgi:hypothetical protein